MLAQKRVEVDTLAASRGVHRELERAVVDVGVHPLRILPPLREQPPLEAHSKGDADSCWIEPEETGGKSFNI